MSIEKIMAAVAGALSVGIPLAMFYVIANLFNAVFKDWPGTHSKKDE